MSDTLTNALRDATRTSSSYGIQPIATVNPLAGMGSAMELVGKMQGLDKNQAVKAWGEVLQQATDPKTGVVDYPRARALAAARGDTAYGMQEGLKSAQDLQTAGYNLTHAQVSNAHKSMAQLLADYPNGVPQSEVNRVLDNQVAQGIPQHVVDAARTTFGADPVQNTRTILQGLGGNMDAQAALGQSRPSVGQVDTGGGVQGFQRQSPMSSAPPTGAITPSGPQLPTGLTTAQLNTPKTYIHPVTKQQVDGTLGTYLEDHGIKPEDVFIGQQTRGGAPGGSTTVDLGNGRRVSSALTNPANRPGATATPGGPAPPPPATPGASGGLRPTATASPPPPAPATRSSLGSPSVTLQPGEETAIQNRATAAAAAFDNDNKQGDAATGQLTTLANIQSDIAKFTTGSGAGRTLDWKRAAQSWAPPLAKAFGITPTEIAGQEDFLKNVAQLQLAQGMSTDKRLDVVGHMTPQDNLSPEGVDLITRKLQGNADYLKARGKLAREFKGNRLTYDEFQSQIAELDPRVFQVQRMSKPQRDEYFASLTNDAKSELFAARHKAKALGALP